MNNESTWPQHPLANSKLGRFVDHRVINTARTGAPAQWETIYWYQHGEVQMRVEQNSYKYQTIIYKEVEAEVELAW